MGHCMKKKCYENLQSLIEVKKCQSVKCFAEYEVIKEFVIKEKFKCDSISERIRVAMERMKGKSLNYVRS